MKPIISIIVPVYNVERYLEKCIQSLLDQTFSNFELLLIDDGSTDSSSEICDKYAKIDQRIKVIHQSNGGLSSARNSGLDIADGSYIIFIDSDDWVANDMLEALHYNIKKYQADISQCGFARIRNEITQTKMIRHNKIKVYSNMEVLKQFYSNDGIVYSLVCNKLYKAVLLNSIRFPLNRLHEDEYVNYKFIYLAKRIVCTNDRLYFYRQRPNSIMSKSFSIKRLDCLRAYIERAQFYKKINNKQLYQKELLNIFRVISLFYVQVKNINNTRALRYLRNTYRSAFKELIKSGYRDRKLVKCFMGIINPSLYNTL